MPSAVQDETRPDQRIAGQYSVQLSRPLPHAGGGVPAFGVTDHLSGRSDLMALQVAAAMPPRAQALAAFGDAPLPFVLTPLADGASPGPDGEDAFFIICRAPPGPSLAAGLRPWGETELLEAVLRPAAQALGALQQRGLTHRGIRPDNIFRSSPGAPIVLGQSWATPAASLQPAVFEPPYSAICLPSGRGEGHIGDDIYALGVTLLTLALGRLPQTGMDDATLLRRKLELGSFPALIANERVPAGIADLVRAMLAEDPDHRPSPALLQDPSAARARRIAVRPTRRAQYPLDVGGIQVYEARVLAHALAADPTQGVILIRTGAIDRWVRRALGDGTLAASLDAAVGKTGADANDTKNVADPMLVMRVVARLDPMAPLCWRSIAVWPEGMGPALATAHAQSPSTATMLEELIGAEAIRSWAQQDAERPDLEEMRNLSRLWSIWLRNRVGSHRLSYSLNPLLPCGSPLLAGRWVARLPELLPAMEAAAARLEAYTDLPIDDHIAAFIAARFNQNLDGELAALTNDSMPELLPLAQMRLLSRLQGRLLSGPAPALATWLATHSRASLKAWRNRRVRAHLEETLMELAKAGNFAPMLSLLEDSTAREADHAGAKAAAQTIAQIDKQLEDIATGQERRAVFAARVGQEIAAGLGLIALATTLIVAAIG